jgi:hypothetical protein
MNPPRIAFRDARRAANVQKFLRQTENFFGQFL